MQIKSDKIGNMFLIRNNLHAFASDKNASLAKAVTCADHFICADAHNKLCFKTSCGKMLGNHWFIREKFLSVCVALLKLILLQHYTEIFF